MAANPRLIARDGPLKGSVYRLAAQEFSVGRSPTNLLPISDPSISRQHCVIRKKGNAFQLRDLESRNGTFVNGVPVGERALVEGDQIEVGKSIFIFMVAEQEAAETAREPKVQLEDTDPLSGTTMVLRETDANYLWREPPAGQEAPAERLTHLKAILKISTAINSIRDLEVLERRLMECIFDVVPAGRGAILLSNDGGNEFASVFTWDRRAGLVPAFPVSGTVARRVTQEKVGLLCVNVGNDRELLAAKSLLLSQTRSLLAVPLVAFDNVLGLIYLDSTESGALLTEEHLMTAIAAISAVALENAQHMDRLEGENRRLQAEIAIQHNMVGESEPMRKVYRFISKVAPTDATVLITGESGTGKELIARAVHQNSPRAQQPFVAINCAALTETLLESELFGHEKGAFTGAYALKKGKLEVADGGTVFLDEIAELAPQLQAKLLRVLQEREFERVGGTRSIHVNIRVIGATNRNLEEWAAEGKFRQDLYYRLNVVAVTSPSLRQRREDIPLLASYFAAKAGQKANRQVHGLSPGARACLMHYEWPGNVRELENAIERAVVLGASDLILPEDLPEVLLEAQPAAGVKIGTYHEAVTEAKKQLILKAVEQAGGNYTEAAKLLGVHPNYLHRLIRNMNLRPAIVSATGGQAGATIS
jgi:transcriptional regulator with GAF, ATPase, and Fis domain